jgi:hypothetical protein
MNLDTGEVEVLQEIEADARDLGDLTTELDAEQIEAAYLAALDERESVGDIHEDADAADWWWHAGPDRLAEDVAADKLGRKLAVELGGL